MLLQPARPPKVTRRPLVAAASKLWATLFYGHVHRPEDRDAVVKGDTLLARCGKQKKKASSAKKQRGRRAQAEKHSGSYMRVGGVAYATEGGNACGWRLPQGVWLRAVCQKSLIKKFILQPYPPSYRPHTRKLKLRSLLSPNLFYRLVT